MTTTDKTTRIGVTVDRLIAAMEAGAAGERWAMPWHRLCADLFEPTNAATGNPYTRGNRFLLAIGGMLTGYSSGTWATYRQWQSIGAQVRKGEQAAGTIFRPIELKPKATEDTDGTDRTEDEEGDEAAPRIRWRAVAVFNAAQVDGWEPDNVERHHHDPIEAAEALLDAWQQAGMNVIEGGDRAYWSRTSDEVHVPDRTLFARVEHFYATVAHEATHWTAPRLGRELGERFGDDAYAAEELVAELGAAALCGHLGIEPATRTDHATYLAGWLRVLKADPMHLWTVATQAGQATDHLLSLLDTPATEAA